MQIVDVDRDVCIERKLGTSRGIGYGTYRIDELVDATREAGPGVLHARSVE